MITTRQSNQYLSGPYQQVSKMLLLLICFLLSACDSPTPLSIAVLYNAETPQGDSLLKSVKLYEKEYAHKVIRSSSEEFIEVNFRYIDIGFTPESAKRAVRQLLANEDIGVIIGPNSSNQAIPVAEVAEEQQIPMISPGSTHRLTTHNKRFVFRAANTDDFQAKALSTFLGVFQGYRKVGVLYNPNNAYSKYLTEEFIGDFERRFDVRVLRVEFDDAMTGLNSKLEQLKDLDLDALLMPSFDAVIAEQIELIKSVGLTIPLIGTDSWHPARMKTRGITNEVYFSHHWSPSMGSENSQSRDFIEAYLERYGEPPGIISALTHDSVGLVFEMIKQAGTNRLRLRDALMSLSHFPGVTGFISYEGKGTPNKPVLIFEMVNDEIRLKNTIQYQ